MVDAVHVCGLRDSFVILLSGFCITLVFARLGYVFGSWLSRKERWFPFALPWILIPVMYYAFADWIHIAYLGVSLGAFLGILAGGIDPEKRRF